MKKRTGILLVLFITLAILLTSCGSSSSSSASDPTTSNYTFGMMVYRAESGNPAENSILIVSLNEENPTPITSASLVFNNQTVALEQFEMGFHVTGIALVPDQSYPVVLTINGQQFNSTIKVCPSFTSFVNDGNTLTPTLTWSYTGSVQYQSVDGYAMEENGNDYDFHKSIGTSLRTYTFESKHWEENSVTILNYSTVGNNLIISSMNVKESSRYLSLNEKLNLHKKIIKENILD